MLKIFERTFFIQEKMQTFRPRPSMIIFYFIFMSDWFERSISESAGSRVSTNLSQGNSQGPRTMSLDLEKQPSSIPGSGPPSVSSTEPVRPRRTTRHHLPGQTDTRIMVVWLESLEDYAQFPISQLNRDDSFFFQWDFKPQTLTMGLLCPGEVEKMHVSIFFAWNCHWIFFKRYKIVK